MPITRSFTARRVPDDTKMEIPGASRRASVQTASRTIASKSERRYCRQTFGRIDAVLPVRVKFNGESRRVVVHIHPARDAELEGFTLVVFDELPETDF
ncbi:MAG: hypothetical protein R3C99_17910 [Pirellulaceae bacterium]